MIRWLINLLNKRRAPTGPDDLALLTAAVNRGTDCWTAREPGQCQVCGHEFVAGEQIGPVYMTFRRNGTYDPAVRRADSVCVERARLYGDPSLQWAGAR